MLHGDSYLQSCDMLRALRHCKYNWSKFILQSSDEKSLEVYTDVEGTWPLAQQKRTAVTRARGRRQRGQGSTAAS